MIDLLVPKRKGVHNNEGAMGKALVIISLASLVAIVAMAAMVLTSFGHHEEVQLQRDILATKTAESRDLPTAIDRDEAVDLVDDSVFPE